MLDTAAGKPIMVVVDDDPDDSFFIRQAIADLVLPIDCLYLCDGQELLDYLHTSTPADELGQQLPSLVLLDLHMPRLDGRATLVRLRAEPRFRRLPVVVFTTSREPDDQRTCLAAGATSYRSKPFRFDDLKLVLSDLYDRWLLPS